MNFLRTCKTIQKTGDTSNCLFPVHYPCLEMKVFSLKKIHRNKTLNGVKEIEDERSGKSSKYYFEGDQQIDKGYKISINKCLHGEKKTFFK